MLANRQSWPLARSHAPSEPLSGSTRNRQCRPAPAVDVYTPKWCNTVESGRPNSLVDVTMVLETILQSYIISEMTNAATSLSTRKVRSSPTCWNCLDVNVQFLLLAVQCNQLRDVYPIPGTRTLSSRLWPPKLASTTPNLSF